MSGLDSPYSLGFTGTSKPVGRRQEQALRLLLQLYRERPPHEAHHGDCIEADALFHDRVREILPGTRIHIHPPINPTQRAFKKGDVIWEEKEYLDRNQDIASKSIQLIAIPPTSQEVTRSGTWATVRYARRYNAHITIIPPNGIAYSEVTL